MSATRRLRRMRDRIVKRRRMGMPRLRDVIALSILALSGATMGQATLTRETDRATQRVEVGQQHGVSTAGMLFAMFPPWKRTPSTGGGASGNYRAPTTSLPTGVTFSTATGLFTGSPYWTSGGVPALPSNWADAATDRPANGTQLQTALNSAVAGTTIIELDPAVTYTAPSAGSFTFPAFSGTGYVIIRTGTAGSSMSGLPAFGTRINPATHESSMATIAAFNAVNERALKIGGSSGLGKLWVAGVRLLPPSGFDCSQMIEMGGTVDSTTNHPSDVVFDRCYLKGDETRNHRRGLQFHVNGGAVLSSYIAGFSDTGTDAQGLAMWHCTGGIHIENCFIEGAAENMMIGGSTASTPASTVEPSDILFYRNHFRKRASWKGTSRIVKNIFEVKFGNRVLAVGNVLNQCWEGFGQHASAFNLKTSVDAAHLSAHNITMRYNKVYDSGMVLTMNSGEAGVGITPIAMNALDFSDNLAYNINTATYSTTLCTAFYATYNTTNGIDDMTIDHNTVVAGTGTVNGIYTMTGDRTASQTSNRGLFSNNILECGNSAASLTGWRWGTEGATSINMMFNMSTSTVRNNAMINRNAVSSNYTSVGSNWQFPTTATIGFADYAGGNYTITGGTALNAGSDGRSLGADIAIINTITSGVESP